MPKIYEFAGLRVMIYTDDHRPAHVHVIGNGCVAVFVLHCPSGPPVLRENYRFARHEVTDIKREVAKVLKSLCEAWGQVHGSY